MERSDVDEEDCKVCSGRMGRHYDWCPATRKSEPIDNVTPVEREEWKALAEADTLHMLPTEALIASIKHLATRLLEITHESGGDRP